MAEKKADPKAIALYLGTLAGVAAVSWLASRLGEPKPHPRMDEVSG